MAGEARLEGRSFIVTGAGSGLGRAYALDLALHGAAVLVNDVDGDAAEAVVAEIGATGATAVADDHTVADALSAAAIVAHALTAFGALDGLVNNAGIFNSGHGLLWAVSDTALRLHGARGHHQRHQRRSRWPSSPRHLRRDEGGHHVPHLLVGC